MTYTEKELDQFLHGISLSLLSKKSAQHWRYDEETAREIEWLEALERKVRADKADRKTEPFDKDINVRSKDEPQTEEHCENCRHKDECEGATYEYKNTEWWCLAYAPIDEPQTEQVGVPFGEMDEATFKSHCLNCQRDTADIKCLDCDGNKYFLPYGSKTDCAWK